jgi:DNA-binding beta-propeller fold protein YncE
MTGMPRTIAHAVATAACVGTALLGLAGCTSGGSAGSSAATGAPFATGAASAGGTASATGAASGAGSSAPARPARSLASPGCSGATVREAALSRVRTAMVPMPGSPFGAAVTPDGKWAFVAVGGQVEVLRSDGSLRPAVVRTIPVPGSAVGETITADGRYLLAADGSGAVVISVARAEQGAPDAVLGTLSTPSPGSVGGSPVSGASATADADLGSAIEVAVSPDRRFAFVTLEYADRAVVFNLARALTSGFGAADYVGSIPLGQAAVGLAVSPDGRWLYATSEIGLASQDATSLRASTGSAAPTAGAAARSAGAAACPGTIAGEAPGTLSVIDLRRAESDPAHSVAVTADAGFQPVRVITSADGAQVWVTARASDNLLCFSAARLVSAPADALVAVVRVGEAPVGLMAVRGGSLIVVADSNRFGASGAASDLDLVSVADALAGRPAVLGHIAAGQFPREMAVPPGGDGTLLVTNFQSSQLEAVDVATLPGA